MFGQRRGSRRLNGCHLPAGARSRCPEDVGPELGASRTDLKGFANDFSAAGGSIAQFAIRGEDHGDGLMEVGSGFGEGRTLRVGTGQLFDESDVSLGHFAKHGGELERHETIIRRGREA